MLEQIKKALVDSYIGAIGLGWMFAQTILHFAYIFSAPITGWLTRRQYHGFVEHETVRGFLLRDSLPELLKFSSLLIVGYLLLRWLYFEPLGGPSSTVPSAGGADQPHVQPGSIS